MEKQPRRTPATNKALANVKPKPDSSREKKQAKEPPLPGELTQKKENPEDGNIGKNNAGGYK